MGPGIRAQSLLQATIGIRTFSIRLDFLLSESGWLTLYMCIRIRLRPFRLRSQIDWLTLPFWTHLRHCCCKFTMRRKNKSGKRFTVHHPGRRRLKSGPKPRAKTNLKPEALAMRHQPKSKTQMRRNHYRNLLLAKVLQGWAELHWAFLAFKYDGRADLKEQHWNRPCTCCHCCAVNV